VRGIRIVVLVFSSLILIAGGSMLYMASVRGKFVPGVDFSQPRHPVTNEMATSVLKLNRKVGRFFKLPDTTGTPVPIGGQGPKPQFLFFVKKGCPCSFEAEPIIQDLYRHFGGKVEFIAVTDAGFADAKLWKSDLKVPYPVVSNPKLEVMESYEAPGSVYSTLLDANGLIVKRWAGYSQDYLREMNEEMSRLLGEKVMPFDAKYAPKAKTSGCAFDGYKAIKG
jgi:peroxiredoxin